MLLHRCTSVVDICRRGNLVLPVPSRNFVTAVSSVAGRCPTINLKDLKLSNVRSIHKGGFFFNVHLLADFE